MRTFSSRTNRSLLATGVLFTLLLTSCTDSQRLGVISTPEFFDGLYTTRPTAEEPFVTIIRLKTPALLELAQREDGKLVIDPDNLAQINAEQAATIEDLKKISPKIRILMHYKSVLNGLAIWAPGDVYEKIKSLPNVSLTERSTTFTREPLSSTTQMVAIGKNTSVKFIGAESAYRQNLFGQGMKVGIIDTGIDYTHKMFLGEGTEEAYKAIDPQVASSSFPNKKVVGGIDLAGSEYNTSSPFPEKRIPKPDPNPLDESGHGTHVAGTVAGIGDGVNTYDGVAPAADLYAIKVFGKGGTTSDEVVIAALEYAVNPSGDLKYEDQLDVVNLSLGGGYGNPHIMYAHAIKNTAKAGTIVVASAGNSGDKPFIVGAPGISDEAISVASSIDNSDQNVLFPAAEFSLGSEKLNVEVIDGAISKPLSDVSALQGELIDLGYADADFTSPLKDQIAGKVAFVERGKVAFGDKIKRAVENGAIAVVVMNNSDEDPIVMGGDGKYDVPAVMIARAAGLSIRAAMENSAVTVDLKPKNQIQKPWLVDTISPFSSRGPRSEDGMIKPEISAPGTNIISADMGAGHKGVPLSGTSMAGPHIAGVMVLLKQKFKDLPAQELKSVLMGHGKLIADEEKNTYPVSRQGAGRVQIEESLNAKIVSIPAAMSFGLTDLEKQKTLSMQVTFKNISSEVLTLNPVWNGSKALKLSAPTVTLDPEEEKTVTIKATLVGNEMDSANEELDGFLKYTDGKKTLLQIPALVVARQISQMKATSLKIHATSEADSAGSFAELVLENKGVNQGQAYLFNLLGVDSRKANNRPDYFPNRNCDLQSAGYRIIESEGTRTLQIAVKLYEGMTTWHACEVNVQIDSDNDNKTDQEIAGLPMSSLPGLDGEEFISLLLDGTKAREIRKKYELTLALDPTAKENYTPAIQDQRAMKVFDNSTLAIIEADISLLALSAAGELSLKVSTTHQDAGILEYDDYLAKQSTQWKKISVHPMAQAYTELPEVIKLDGKESTTLSLVKGYGSENLIVYMPQNKSVRDVLLTDAQSQVVNAKYEAEEEVKK